MTTTISPEQQIVQTRGNLASNMNGDKVLMSIVNGKYYNLGQVGGRIWELIADPISLEQLNAALLDEYEVDPAECEEQIQTFLNVLLSEGLIQVSYEFIL